MNEHPKISIIMPSLNVIDYISQCIDSVLNQTLNDIEILCVDAGSTDGTLEILKDYSSKDSRIKLIKSDEKSYGHQMNLAMNIAKGEYIGIVETDDYIKKDMYESLYNLSDEGNVDIVKSTFWHVYDYDPIDIKLKVNNGKKNLPPETESFTVFENANILDAHPSIWSGIYRRPFLEKNNIRFMEVPGGGWVDNPFFIETSILAKSIRYIDKPFYYYRESNPNSSSNNLSDYTLPIKRAIDNIKILEKYDCKDEDVLLKVYNRCFAYINNIKRREGYEEYWDDVLVYIQEMVKMFDEEVVLKKLNFERQIEYCNLLFNKKDKTILTEEEYYLKKKILENNITKLENKNKKLIKENKKLNKNITRLNKENKKLLSSNSWKITKPLRKIRNLK